MAASDPPTTHRELAVEQPGDPADWTKLSLADLASHIQDTHHRYLWEELPKLNELVDTIVEVHGSNHPELAEVQTLYTKLRTGMEPHLKREDEEVFPAIRHLDSEPDVDLGDVIQTMITQHDNAGALLDRLHTLTDGFTVPSDGGDTYRATYVALAELEADTHLHVHKEDNVLYAGVLDQLATTPG